LQRTEKISIFGKEEMKGKKKSTKFFHSLLPIKKRNK